MSVVSSHVMFIDSRASTTTRDSVQVNCITTAPQGCQIRVSMVQFDAPAGAFGDSHSVYLRMKGASLTARESEGLALPPDQQVDESHLNPSSILAKIPITDSSKATQQMIAGAGALAPLMKLTQYGSDMGKLSAMGALDVLTVNNPLVQQELLTAGAPKLLSGLESMGAQLLREQAGSFGARLRDEKAAAAAPKLDEAAHVRAARDTRIKYDGLRQRAVRMMQGWGDERSTHRSGR